MEISDFKLFCPQLLIYFILAATLPSMPLEEGGEGVVFNPALNSIFVLKEKKKNWGEGVIFFLNPSSDFSLEGGRFLYQNSYKTLV